MEIMGVGNIDLKFWKAKKVLITGHTGFKGSWLCMFLNQLEAKVSGYALEPPTEPNLFSLCNINSFVDSTIGDIRDFDSLIKKIDNEQPEIIIHMAAQPLVRLSYNEPVLTYQTNVIGTVNLLEAVRVSKSKSVRVIVNVTTDKCYENKEWLWPYRENEPLGGYDPYSSSKACSELVTSSYRNSFFNPEKYDQHKVAIASARAGNVIGGGDWAEDRLVPDILRAIIKGDIVKIRSPYAIRPWQHVIEPLSGYLILCEKLYNQGTDFAESWNFGPDDKHAKNVEWITETIGKFWGEGASYEIDKNPQPHEASYLKLDCSKAKSLLGWHPRLDIETTLKLIVDWNKAYLKNYNMRQFSIEQIENFFI
jgi:CDP-glucose 4,6-dehydratase